VASGVAILGRNLMFMNALLLCYICVEVIFLYPDIMVCMPVSRIVDCASDSAFADIACIYKFHLFLRKLFEQFSSGLARLCRTAAGRVI